MTTLRPTPRQERWMQVPARTGLSRDAAWLAERSGGWKFTTSLARCVFFILGSFAAALTAAVLELLHVPGYLYVTGGMLVAAAEYLILRRRFFGAGIEEALYLAGLLMIGLPLVSDSGDASGVSFSLTIAAALLVAGLRLLNPFLITLCGIAISCAIGFAGAHGAVGPLTAADGASAFCLIVACLSLYAHRVHFQRPSYDQMLNGLIVTMPLAAYLWFKSAHVTALAAALVGHARVVAFLLSLLLVLFGLGALAVGVRRRVHAPIVASMVCVGCLAYELRNLSSLSLPWKLIGWGTLALLLALGVDRYLRSPRRGITSVKLTDGSGSLNLLHLAGAGALVPHSVPASDTTFKGDGGTFGGGGAGGNF